MQTDTIKLRAKNLDAFVSRRDPTRQSAMVMSLKPPL
jgi:hypothetical protein